MLSTNLRARKSLQPPLDRRSCPSRATGGRYPLLVQPLARELEATPSPSSRSSSRIGQRSAARAPAFALRTCADTWAPFRRASSVRLSGVPSSTPRLPSPPRGPPSGGQPGGAGASRERPNLSPHRRRVPLRRPVTPSRGRPEVTTPNLAYRLHDPPRPDGPNPRLPLIRREPRPLAP